jgi:hypothetical protein
MLLEELGYAIPAASPGYFQRRVSIIVPGIDVYSRRQEHPHYLFTRLFRLDYVGCHAFSATSPSGLRKAGPPEIVFSMGIGTSLQEELDLFSLTPPGCCQ